MSKVKKSLTGYMIRNWGLVVKDLFLSDSYIIHDYIYEKPTDAAKTKVRITIEEIS
jgi:hypothetical protein